MPLPFVRRVLRHLRLRRLLILALVPALVAGCGPRSSYPKDWPSPSPAWFGCPDLGGRYDGVGAELPALIAPDRQFGKRFYHEHSVTFERDPKGERYTLTLQRNERGLADFRDWHLKYNQNGSLDGGRVKFDIVHGEDFTCSRGWLIGKTWVALEQPRGDPKRVRLAFAKDRAGNLIAAVTTNSEASFGWADSRRISLGHYDETRWLHWTKRPAQADKDLQAAGSVSLLRYRWTNPGGRVPARFTNFMPGAVCVKAEHMERFQVRPPIRPPMGEGKRKRTEEAPAPQCDAEEQKLDQGDVLRLSMPMGRSTWVHWHALGTDPGTAERISVPAPEDLPVIDLGR